MNAPVRWQPNRTVSAAAQSSRPGWPLPALGKAVLRGAAARCPSCGQTRLFDGYLRVTPVCGVCGAPLGSARADDAPPYFTILIAGHLIVPLMLLFQNLADPSDMLTAGIFLPLTAALTIGLLRPVKGATVGLMMKLGLMKADAED